MKFNKLIPELGVKHLAASVAFYTNVLGFTIAYERPENKFVFLEREGSQIMIEEDPQEGVGKGMNFQIEVVDLQELLARIKKNNYPIEREIYERAYQCGKEVIKQYELLVRDPDGYLLRFVQEFD